MNYLPEEEPAAALDLELMRRYVALARRVEALKKVMDAVQKEMRAIDPKIQENMASAGIPFIGVGYGKALKVTSQTFAKVYDKEKAKAALRATGYEDLIEEKYDSGRISALVRELLNGDGLPPEFDGVIEPNDKFYLKVVADPTA